MNIKGLDFHQTCVAFPEQYDVEYNGEIAGYVRLRGGILRVDYPNCGDETIYITNVRDGNCGMFESQEEREQYLNIAAEKILEKMSKLC